ncbi:MAG: lactate utilization protein C [Hyphomicrobiaceae bacterium]
MSVRGNDTSRRDKVLGAVRSRLGRPGAPGRGGIDERLNGQARHLIPARSLQEPRGLRALFSAQLRSGNATVLEAARDADIPAVIAEYLRGQNLPLTLRCGDDAWLASIDWPAESALTIVKGRAQPADEVGLTHAVAGIAETGTLMLASGPANPVTVTFLPETSIVVLRAGDLMGHYEAAFDRLRERYGRGSMPRTVNLVSGPSRTADVGGRLVTGAHGPRRFCVVLVG